MTTKASVAEIEASEVAQLERLRAAGPEKGLISVAGGWEGSEELVETMAEIRRLRRNSAPQEKKGQ
jgi:hypothetical protein